MSLYVLGTLLIVTAMAAALTSIVSYVLLTRGHLAALPFGRWGVRSTALAAFGAAGLLVYLFVSGQYGFDYVYNYSSSDLELRYKFAAIWAGQQGSFLVWLLPGMVAALFLIRRSREYEPYVLAPLMLIHACLLIFMLVRNPFQPLIIGEVGSQQIVAPPDGKGLNELLHNPWMVIHPPVLFTGYSLLALPFSYAIGGLWRRDFDGWVRRALPWSIAAFAVLGTALAMGGYWAYETLGWGGYWAWDPVENSSLVPWLLVTALMHGMLLQRTHGGLRRTNIVIAILSYASVFYASFLTRSGVLSNFSVHSFTEAGLGWVMTACGSGLVVIATVLLMRRWRSIPYSGLSERLMSRDSFFVLAIITLGLIAVIVTFGTSMPLLSALPGANTWLRGVFRAWFDPGFQPTDGRFSLRPEFYKQTTPPLGLVAMLLLTVGPLLGWRSVNGGKLVRALRIPGLLAVLASAGAMLIGVTDLMSVAYVGLGVFAIGSNGVMIFRTLKGGWMRIGGYLAHVGMAILLIGVVGSMAYANPDQRLVIPLGQSQTAYGHTITFTGYQIRPNAQGVEKGYLQLVVERNGSTWVAEPLLYFNDRMNAEMKNPAVKSYLTEDLYISPEQYIGGSDPNMAVLAVNGEQVIGPYTIIFKHFDLSEAHTDSDDARATIGAVLSVTYEGQTSEITPKMQLVADELPTFITAELPDGKSVRLDDFDPISKQVRVSVLGLNLPADPPKADIFVSTKPGIGLVWIGTLVMIGGGVLASVRRALESSPRRRTARVPASAPGAAGQTAG